MKFKRASCLFNNLSTLLISPKKIPSIFYLQQGLIMQSFNACLLILFQSADRAKLKYLSDKWAKLHTNCNPLKSKYESKVSRCRSRQYYHLLILYSNVNTWAIDYVNLVDSCIPFRLRRGMKVCTMYISRRRYPWNISFFFNIKIKEERLKKFACQ